MYHFFGFWRIFWLLAFLVLFLFFSFLFLALCMSAWFWESSVLVVAESLEFFRLWTPLLLQCARERYPFWIFFLAWLGDGMAWNRIASHGVVEWE